MGRKDGLLAAHAPLVSESHTPDTQRSRGTFRRPRSPRLPAGTGLGPVLCKVARACELAEPSSV